MFLFYLSIGADGDTANNEGTEDEKEEVQSEEEGDSEASEHDEIEDDDDDDDADSESIEDDSDDEDILYVPQVFPIMGSWKENRYQDVLTEVQNQMALSKDVSVRVKFEQNNPEDINAIKAEARIEGNWKIFGTIMKSQISKLTRAMRRNTVNNCRFRGAPRYEINVRNSGYNGLTCKLIIEKRGRWERDDFDYRYNDDLSRL